MTNKILLDTSFFIRLLTPTDPLNQNAIGYYKYFIEQNFILLLSTISIAEYCVKGKRDELPLKNLQILPFNINHAEKAGKFANIIFSNKNTINLSNRAIIPNDVKLFAQADCEYIHSFASSDAESEKMVNLLKLHSTLKFNFINIYKPFNEYFGVLNL